MNQAKELFSIAPTVWEKEERRGFIQFRSHFAYIWNHEFGWSAQIDGSDESDGSFDTQEEAKACAESRFKDQLLKHLTKAESSDQKLERVKEWLNHTLKVIGQNKTVLEYSRDHEIAFGDAAVEVTLQSLLEFIESLDK